MSGTHKHVWHSKILSWIIILALIAPMCHVAFVHAEETRQEDGQEPGGLSGVQPNQTGSGDPQQPGDTNILSSGDAGVLSSGDMGILSSGDAGVLSSGDAGILSSGDAGILSPGDANILTPEGTEGEEPEDAGATGRARVVPAVPPHSDGRRHKFVSGWDYVFAGDSAIQNVGEQYSVEVSMVFPHDLEKLIARLEGTLPRQISGSGSNYGSELINAGFIPDTENPGTGTITGRVNITWDVEKVVKQYVAGGGKVAEGTVLTFDAKPVSNDGFLIRVNTNDPDFDDSKGDEADTAETDGILNLTVTLHELSLEGHTVTSVNPPATRVDLFDYWVDTDGAAGDDILGKSEFHKNAAGVPVERTCMTDWNKGINQGRLLLFGDGNIHAGFWNKGAGAGGDYGKKYAGMMGIVEPVLMDGYPVIKTEDIEKQIGDYTLIDDWMLCGDHISGDVSGGNAIDEQGRDSADYQNISKGVIQNWQASGNDASLAYLFDPELKNTYRREYTDVEGLFQLDDSGYYYYDMRLNYAEYDSGSNRFKLYDAPGVDRTDGLYESGGFIQSRRSTGNFFPFNSGDEVFTGVDSEGHLVSDATIQSNNRKGIFPFNHHMGMTVSIDFRQPAGGLIHTGPTGGEPMTFQFSGDDDVWIFIDDVLVLDLGGIHSEIFGSIDFSTGEVMVGQSWKTNGFPYKKDGSLDVDMDELKNNAVSTTTLKELFGRAGVADQMRWNGNTFASDSNHTLKMFYLERGNYDSSLALRFNLQPRLYQYIKKVDQNGNPVGGIGFQLYPAETCGENDAGAIACLYTDSQEGGAGPFYIRQRQGESALISLTTGADGVVQFQGEQGEPFHFADLDTEYFVLRETNTPEGYRSLPIDVVLHYDRNTGMLTVANRWSTGAYASSISNDIGNGRLTYGEFDAAGGSIVTGSQTVEIDSQKDGLAVAVPMLKQKSKSAWVALHGSNLSGFDALQIGAGAGEQEWKSTILRSALEQASGVSVPQWHLSWDEENDRLAGTLDDLPGLAGRYQINNADGDMSMVYGLIEPAALEQLGIREETAQARYEALGRYVREHGVDNTVAAIMSAENAGAGRAFSFLNVSQFNRTFRSLIYIPNEQRELWVMKVDENGVPRNGATFGLYTDPACRQLAASGVTATVDGQDGLLIFSPRPGGSGHAQIAWASSARTQYYLREISAPGGSGLNVNPTVIPIVVGTYSIYADAGTRDDGVSVLAGVGRLVQTMVQYANDGDVDITLRDITAYGQYQPSENRDVPSDQWQDMELHTTLANAVLRSMNLHYHMNATMDYGLHDIDGGKVYKPFFITDTGFIRARVEQNYPALTGQDTRYETVDADTNKDNLTGINITSLFSLLNVVVVEDRADTPPDTGRLLISKTLTGTGLTAADYTRFFTFTLELRDASGAALTGGYYFWGKDKTGIIRNGDTIVLRHDDEITIQGLPTGTRFTVTEQRESGWYTDPDGGVIQGTIEKGVTSAAEFTNSRQPIPPKPATGSLTVSKLVTGGAGDKNKEFTFTITLKDVNDVDLSESYAYSGAKSGTVSSGDAITLMHGQSVTVRGLPVGTKYTVTESDNEGYVVTVTGETGEIAADTASVAAFTNHRDPDRPPQSDPPQNTPKDPEKPEEPEDPFGPPDDSEETVVREGGSPETGDTDPPAVKMLFRAASASAAGLMILYFAGVYQRIRLKKKNAKKEK